MPQLSPTARNRSIRALSLTLLLLAGDAAAQSSDVIFQAGFDEALEGPFNAGEASRFLSQATFGPTLAEISRLQGMGYNAWLSEQFTRTASLHLPLVDQRIQNDGIDNVWQGERHEEWFRIGMTGNDQLRQRVAFALSQILVTSDQSGALEGNPNTLANYYDVLVSNAFGNYRTLLEQVTLHPAMGRYLSMYKNRKSNRDGTIRPDENYAREIMQLFSIGLVMLNPDGTVRDGNATTAGVQPIPTYDLATIKGLAAVFTGWNDSTCRPSLATDRLFTSGPGANDTNNDGEYDRWWEWEYCPDDPVDNTNWKLARAHRTPMTPWEVYHQSTGTKQLLRYSGNARGRVDANGVLAAGGTARENLAAALDNVYFHPNLGPFISRQLIQRLVTSNPTPGYVQRVAAAFDDDNGAAAGGARGNLRAVVAAILLDDEARRPLTTACTNPQSGCVGKLREPLLRLTQLFRALDAQPTHPRGYWTEGYPEYATAQAALRSPTVFNFFQPGYALPGPEVAGRGLVSPEFQITVDTSITRMTNSISGRVMWTYLGNPGLPTSGEWRPVAVNLDRDMQIANDAAQLIERYNVLFMGGQMSAPLRQLLLDHTNGYNTTSFGWASDTERRRWRVQDAIWLIATAPEFIVEK
jgi:uncharacterized protein (DUF1800 family)